MCTWLASLRKDRCILTSQAERHCSTNLVYLLSKQSTSDQQIDAELFNSVSCLHLNLAVFCQLGHPPTDRPHPALALAVCKCVAMSWRLVGKELKLHALLILQPVGRPQSRCENFRGEKMSVLPKISTLSRMWHCGHTEYAVINQRFRNLTLVVKPLLR